MARFSPWSALGLVFILSGAQSGLYAAESKPYIIDNNDLTFSLEQIQAGNPRFLKAENALIQKANSALNQPLLSVMDKTLVAASGDKHDYYSFPPYWWPDPTKKDGLPYIRKDGQNNPDASSDATDKKRLVRMSNNVSNLALAWYFTKDQRYSDKAAEQIRTWFLNPATRMNPNMAYAQATPGVNTGRGTGIIDTRVLVNVVDAIQLLHSSGAITEIEYNALKKWFGELYYWMTVSPNGLKEDSGKNNHGTWYDLQTATFAQFSGKTDDAKKRLNVTQNRRIPNHFDAEGKQMREVARTRSWHYSNFNLEAYSQIAELGEKIYVDIWNHNVDNHNLHNGYRYIANFIDSKTPWPWKDMDKMDDRKALLSLSRAAKTWPDDTLLNEKARYLQAKYPEDITILLAPLPVKPEDKGAHQ
ncbi:alginate lyase family protein [uncultured Cedecea sp.]|uniref:alginate lyase family protein n=1 Tax=uncultured Cedecea sp. TaxID=988762 RepID=UPI002628A68C|nr:alginate lyase family protein [uncultured Cedecea sp.]